MNLQYEHITQQDEELQLDTLVTAWTEIAAQAVQQESSFADFLERLLTCHLDARRERSLSIMLKMSTLPAVKPLEQDNFKFSSGHRIYGR